MTPHRLAIKLFLEDPASADADAMIPLFHRWIQQPRLPGLLMDVADYKHVPDGPGVILIGHEADYGLDFSAGRPGLLTVRKRVEGLSLAEAVLQTLDLAVGACQVLEEEKLARPLRFAVKAFELTLLDRLHVENSDVGLKAVQGEIEGALKPVIGAAKLMRISADAREALRLEIAPEKTAGLAAWAAALKGKAPVLAAAR